MQPGQPGGAAAAGQMPAQFTGGVNPMMNMMGNQMLGQVQAQMVAPPGGAPVQYNYQPQN